MSSLRTATAHKFAFGLGYGGGPMRDQLTAERTKLVCESVARLGELGGWGVGVCADDLFVADSTAHERSDAVATFLDALDGAGMVASSTTSPGVTRRSVYGALTASERSVRRHALQQTVCAVDLAAELGAAICVVPPEAPAAPPAGSPIDALARYREAVEFVCGYIRDQGVAVRLALASPASATHGHALLPTVGHTLAFIGTLDEPGIVGVDVAVADTLSATPASYQGVAQLLAADKLLQVDLSLRAIGRCGHEAARRWPPRPTRRHRGPLPAREAARGVGLRRGPGARPRRTVRRGRRGYVGAACPHVHAHVPRAGRQGPSLRR